MRIGRSKRFCESIESDTIPGYPTWTMMYRICMCVKQYLGQLDLCRYFEISLVQRFSILAMRGQY